MTGTVQGKAARVLRPRGVRLQDEQGGPGRRSGRRRCAAILLAVVLAGPVAGLPAQTVQGTLRDRTSRAPVADATVELRTSGGSLVDRAASDSAGSFVLDAPHGGLFMVQVEALGYAPTPGQFVQLAEGEETTLQLELRLQPAFRLEPLEATAQRVVVRLAEKGFYDRRETGRGFFLGPEDLERRPPVTEAEVVARAPFVFANYGRRGTTITMRSRGRSCQPALVIDDMEVRGDPYLEHHVNFADIAAVEIFRGYAEMPWELAIMNDCGLVMIWTKRAVGGGGGEGG